MLAAVEDQLERLRGVPARLKEMKPRDLLRAARSSLWVQVVIALYLYKSVWAQVSRRCQLPFDSYGEPSLVFEAWIFAPFTVFFGLAVIPLVIGWRRLRWSEWDSNGATRRFVMVVVAVMAWAFSTYDLNLFFDQPHTLDRLLLILLAALVWRHPLFAVPFLAWLTVIISQLHFPLPGSMWHWPDKRLPWDMILLFCCFLYSRLVVNARAQAFAFLALCLTGATYSHAAISKMSIGPSWWTWPWENHLSNIFVGAYKNGGWLSGLSTDSATAVAQGLDLFHQPIGIATLVIEIAGLALLLHRRLTLWILGALIAMHLGIYMTTGIFFWKWICLDAALAWYVRKLRAEDSAGRQKRPRAVLPGLPVYGVVLSVYLMLQATAIFSTINFAWWDSRLTNFFVLRAETPSGRSLRLDPRFFAPYDIILQQSRFYYLTDRPVLAGTYATVRRWDKAQALQTAEIEDIPRIRAEMGSRGRSKSASAVFERFVRTVATNANRRGQAPYWLHRLAPPYHFQTTMTPDTYDYSEPIVEVTVEFQEWFYDGRIITPTAREEILSVPVPPPVEPTP